MNVPFRASEAGFESTHRTGLAFMMLHLPGLRLPWHGIFAAIGMIAALWLSPKTAERVGLAPERLWDAGLFLVMAGFVISRMTLIASDPRGFLRLPLVMLALPSYTWADASLTALAGVIYLRWKEIPLLAALDAWAPCAAALGSILSLGRWLEGEDRGMPTHLPWGPAVPGSAGLMHLQPVDLYAALAFLILLVTLMKLLEGGRRRGSVAGVALTAFGALLFLLDMLTQPESGPGAWLDPVQWLAVGLMLGGGLLFLFLPEAA